MKRNISKSGSLEFASQLPEPFNFYRIVLDSDHLHFGLWPSDEPDLTLEQAQKIMFERLKALLPPPPRTLLDVGCGLGKSAAVLSGLGYEITAIAPSAALIDYAQSFYETSGVQFVEMGFLDEKESLPRLNYDILFFQESLQYLRPLTAVFHRVRELLKPGGILLVSDETVEDLSICDHTAVHASMDIESNLAVTNFDVTHRENLSDCVSATCDHVIARFSSHRDKILQSCGIASDASLDYFLRGWQQQRQWYRAGQMGYSIWRCRQR